MFSKTIQVHRFIIAYTNFSSIAFSRMKDTFTVDVRIRNSDQRSKSIYTGVGWRHADIIKIKPYLLRAEVEA